jgi:hypothetical protein
MNELFVCVKVDREERPDVDQIYMDAVVRLHGHGGWPLTVFCTPDGRPFYGGTYFPPEPRHGLPGFREVLRAVARAYRERRGEVDESAGRIVAALRARPTGVARALPGPGELAEAARELLAQADREHGGFGAGPKFPTPSNLELLLAACDALPEGEAEDALSFLAFTCREMSRRGLYDHLGGGFHRYCVDRHWGVPHFEKMLYDQGQLLRVYAEVWRRTGAADDDLVWPIRETAGYLGRELRAEDGGFCASQDADSEGVEGKFYVWTPAEVRAVLGEERGAAFCAAYGVTERGNFEHGTTVLQDVARRPRADFAAERAALYEARAKRVWPGTDRKRLAAWNALAVSGLACAGALLGDAALVDEAARTADFVLEKLRDGEGRLLRVYAEGRAKQRAFLDDEAAALAACLDLHRAGAGDRWLPAALDRAEEIVRLFFDPEENDLFLTPADGEPLAHRPRSDHDGATPHSTGLAVLGLLRAASLSGREDLRRVAERVIRSHAFLLERAPLAYPTLLRAAACAERGLGAAVIAGDGDDEAAQALARRARLLLAPEDAVLVVPPSAAPPELDPSWTSGRGALGGRPTAYLCRGTTCSLPITDPDQLRKGSGIEVKFLGSGVGV